MLITSKELDGVINVLPLSGPKALRLGLVVGSSILHFTDAQINTLRNEICAIMDLDRKEILFYFLHSIITPSKAYYRASIVFEITHHKENIYNLRLKKNRITVEEGTIQINVNSNLYQMLQNFSYE